jgi:hypothetical protein
VLELHSPITLDAPVTVKINTSNQGWFGLDGGLNRITSKVQGGPALRFCMGDTVPKGTAARGMIPIRVSLKPSEANHAISWRPDRCHNGCMPGCGRPV